MRLKPPTTRTRRQKTALERLQAHFGEPFLREALKALTATDYFPAANALREAGPDSTPLHQLVNEDGAVLLNLKMKNRAWNRTMVMVEWLRNGRRDAIRFHFDRGTDPWTVADYYFVNMV